MSRTLTDEEADLLIKEHQLEEEEEDFRVREKEGDEVSGLGDIIDVTQEGEEGAVLPEVINLEDLKAEDIVE